MEATMTTGFSLRPYQIEAVDKACEELAQHQSTLLVMATGTGKTEVFSEIIKRQLPRVRVLVLAHTRELIFQTAKRIERRIGERVDIEMGSMQADRQQFWKARVIVSTVQTQDAGETARMERFDPNDFALVVCDEAHHYVSPQFRRVVDYYRQNPRCKVVGVTATPDRADEKALGQMFESCAFEFGILDAIQGGWLVPIAQEYVSIDGLDFSGIETVAGDFNGRQLAEILEHERPIHEMAHATFDIAAGRRTILFCHTVKQAEMFAEILNRHEDGCADWVCGETLHEDRKAKLASFARGDYRFLTNVGVLLEGFDDPGIEVVAVCKPTKSRPRYVQIIGRGTRPLPGVVDGLETADDRREAIALSSKPEVLVIDFKGNSGRHKLVHAADVLGGDFDDEVVERAKRILDEESGGVDAALRLAEQQIEEEKRRAEAAKRKPIVGKATYQRKAIDPFAAFDIMPRRERGWETGRAPSEKMVAMLSKQGIDANTMTYAQCRQVIAEIFRRWDKKLCTLKQANLLKRFGYDPKDIGIDQAKKLIDAIANNGWRRPDQ